jgi:hypothetical protein
MLTNFSVTPQFIYHTNSFISPQIATCGHKDQQIGMAKLTGTHLQLFISDKPKMLLVISIFQNFLHNRVISNSHKRITDSIYA